MRDPNFCIGDTVSTYDVTFRKSVMTNTETPKYSSGLVSYNGENDKPELIGSITAKKFDTNVNIKFKLQMNEVSYTPNYRFNFFSIGKRLRQGWKLWGNDE